MVRSYLIENRICFDSDPGSGGAGGGKPDRSNPSEMRQREQDFVDSRYGGDSEAFMGDVDAGAYSDLAQSEQAAAEAQAREGVMNQGSDRGLTMQDMAPINNPVQNDIARQRLAEHRV